MHRINYENQGLIYYKLVYRSQQKQSFIRQSTRFQFSHNAPKLHTFTDVFDFVPNWIQCSKRCLRIKSQIRRSVFMQRARPPRKQRKKNSGIICGNHISPQNNGSCHLRKVSLAAIARYTGQIGRNKSLRILYTLEQNKRNSS